mgnify:CR=1 FL=1
MKTKLKNYPQDRAVTKVKTGLWFIHYVVSRETSKMGFSFTARCSRPKRFSLSSDEVSISPSGLGKTKGLDEPEP